MSFGTLCLLLRRHDHFLQIKEERLRPLSETLLFYSVIRRSCGRLFRVAVRCSAILGIADSVRKLFKNDLNDPPLFFRLDRLKMHFSGIRCIGRRQNLNITISTSNINIST